MSAKIFRAINTVLEAADTCIFIAVSTMVSILAAGVMAWQALTVSWLLWVVVLSFLLQAIFGVKVLAHKIVAKMMQQIKKKMTES